MLTVFRVISKGTTGFSRCAFSITQVANLTGKTTRGEPLKLKKPFPYWKRQLTTIEALIDLTVKRVEEENAKLIVVDGPIASGKSAAIKLLAEEFDMIYMSQPTMDELYTTSTGFDLRTFDEQLPETVRSYDHKNFLMYPTSFRAGGFQLTMFMLRFSQYIDALTHILNSGQGVVMERSMYSDFGFIEAMFSEGFINERVRNVYHQYFETAKPLVLRPHVVIYLDVPVPKVQERIKMRNLSYEVNSPALTPSFLKKLEDVWKNDYLKEASSHAKVLVYDWSDGGDIDLVVEDLEKLDLDPLSLKHPGQLGDWKTWRGDWRERRLRYTNEKDRLMHIMELPIFDVPEILIPCDDAILRNKLYHNAPGTEYTSGYNVKQGDSFFRTLLGLPVRKSRSLRY